MPEKPLTQQEIKQELIDVTEIAENEKVTLSQEVKQYLHENMRKIMDKLKEGKEIFKEDINFFKEVKAWIKSPESMRNNLSPEQSRQMLGLTKGIDNYKEWLEARFEFKNGKIICKKGLDLSFERIDSLPENLEVNGTLNLEYADIKALPNGLHVIKSLNIAHSTIKKLPPDLIIEADFFLLNTTITQLPENLTIKGNLFMDGTYIKGIPDSISIDRDIIMTEDISEKVKKDAERLKKQGRIKGEIRYV